MASNLVSSTINKVKSTMGGPDAKLASIQHDIVEPTANDRITSDYGVKQNNTDDWLKVVNGDHTGPHLVEDAFAREKVGLPSPAWRARRADWTRIDPPLRSRAHPGACCSRPRYWCFWNFPPEGER